MIGYLRGKILEKRPPIVLVDVGGIGYEVQVPMTTFYHLPEVDQETSLRIHFVVREDAQLLYGFINENDRELFRALIKVSGVGPKLALTILSGMNSVEFSACVQTNDVSHLVRLPGIGKKTAERLLVEMRDRLPEAQLSTAPSPSMGGTMVSHAPSPVNDAISALIALGYKPQEARRAISRLPAEGINSETLIRQALQADAARAL